MSKTTTLSAEQWKSLCLLNVTQLHNFLQAVPSNMESGAPGMDEARMGAIGNHLEELDRFMRAWSLTKLPQAEQTEEAPKAEAAEATEAPKRGGWPKGKPRKPKEVTAEH